MTRSAVRAPAVVVPLALVSLVLATVWVVRTVDADALGRAVAEARRSPLAVVAVLAGFGAAFALRAVVWRRVLPGLALGQAWAAIHVTLGANHVLPLRLGEPLRVVSALRRTDQSPEALAASTLTLRTADILAVLALGAVLGPRVVADLVGPWGWALVAVVAVASLAGLGWLRRLAAGPGGTAVRLPGAGVAVASLVAWLLESVVVWQSARWAGLAISPADAVLVTAVAVTAQIAAVAPGGFGTYEAASVAAYVALGWEPGPALAAALTAHALKTAYSLAAGAVAVVVPAPGLLGRLRLPRRRPASPGEHDPPPAPDRPVVLFLPAHDEAGSVAQVIRRVPRHVAGHPVACLVVDDGSGDATADVAAAAGAEVIRWDANRGLGAAVRAGLQAAVARHACAVAFCDADGEYDPAELATLVAPILAGEADYVVGSRFAGRIDRMLAHRRLGNRVLTALVRWATRLPVSDGQSGYRALSARAAAEAVIAHDYNYAQVLTLDLLAKGYRYAEVPITYAFRREGRSFVRLGRYLAAVLPAMHRVINTGGARPRSVLDDVVAEA